MVFKKTPQADPSPASKVSSPAATQQPSKQATAAARQGTTSIKVNFNCGYNNNLFIRGKGASLSWDKGIPLRNVKADEWIYETTVPFTACEFKILINDVQYEVGENHILRFGDTFEYTPIF